MRPVNLITQMNKLTMIPPESGKERFNTGVLVNFRTKLLVVFGKLQIQKFLQASVDN